MNRKLTICICYLIAGLVLGRDALNAQSTTPIVVFGPKTYTRSSGKPSPQTSAFTVPSSVSGPFTLTVVNGNGSGGDTVASGRISINGIQILGPSDFNQSSRERDDRRDDDRDDRRDDRGSDSNHSSVIKRTVTLKQNNSLSVELMGEPGGSITLSITGFANGPAGTTVPTLVQAVNTSSTAGNVENTYTVRLPNATLSGNSVVLAVQQKSGTGALSVSDDKGNTYNLGKTNDDGVQTVSVFYALNVAAGAQKITLSFAGGANWVAAVAAEFYNVALSSAFDGASATGGVSTLVTAGNLTTTADHDLIFQYATQDTDGTRTVWTQGTSPWTLLAADYFDGQAAQYQVQPAFGTINPTFSQDSSKRFNTVAIALKAAIAGTAPTGMRVVHLGHNHVPQGPGASVPLQFPSTGNLIVLSWIGPSGCDITGVFDGNANVYTSTGPAFGNGGSGDNQLYYVGSAMTSTDLKGLTLSLNNGCEGGSSNALLYDIAGAAASPYDAVAGRPTASGRQTVAGDLTTVTITPSTPSGIIITSTGVTYHTLISVSPGTFLATEPTPDIDTGGIDNNNGWALSYNKDTSPETFVYGTKSGFIYDWASIAVHFKQ